MRDTDVEAANEHDPEQVVILDVLVVLDDELGDLIGQGFRVGRVLSQGNVDDQGSFGPVVAFAMECGLDCASLLNSVDLLDEADVAQQLGEDAARCEPVAIDSGSKCDGKDQANDYPLGPAYRFCTQFAGLRRIDHITSDSEVVQSLPGVAIEDQQIHS